MSIASPLPLSAFEPSLGDRLNARFLPAAAYTSEPFYCFELAAVWQREWISVGRLEEIPEKGDYFTVNVGGEPLIVVRADDGGNGGDIVAMSAVCQHRGMLVADQLKGNCKAFVCPYHAWTYDLRGNLRGAPQMAGVGTYDKQALGLPRLAVDVWQGIIFLNFDREAPPLGARLAPLDAIVADWKLEELRGEFLKDPNYRQSHDYDWNWKVYAEGQAECYHCDKLHADTPGIQNIDCDTMTVRVQDEARGVFAFEMRSKVIDATVNHIGQAVFPPIPSLSEAQRWEQHSIIVAPNIFLQLMPDCVILLSWWPTGPRTMRVKRHRLYPQATLNREDFVERHREESAAIRYFVGQDDRAFASVQSGLESRFAPRGPLSTREFVVHGMTRWLVERYARADAEARAESVSAA
jgi:phenylpropionate dioxygenase-like ring-hydroxylating dioxygenase large terminal subunit